MSMLKSIADVVVRPDHLLRAAKAASRAHDDPEDDAPIEFALLREFGPDRPEPMLFAAIMFRVTALAQVVLDKTAQQWTIEIGGVRHVLVAEALLAAAATATLNYDSQNVWFNPDELVQLALSAAEPKGRG